MRPTGPGRELALWRVVLVALLALGVRLAVGGYAAATVYLLVTGGFEGWW